MISAVIGLQYGDEGKGRYLDYLLKDYDVSIRFNGGDNAGHQCYINGNKYSVHLVPTGVFRNKKSLIANECVLNPISFCQELKYLEENGFDTNCIYIGSKVTLVCPFHQKIDEFFENNSQTNLGTTKQGIGYAYADKMMRFALRMQDCLLNSNEIYHKYLKCLQIHKGHLTVQMYNHCVKMFEKFLISLMKLKKHMCDVTQFFTNCLNDNLNILFEGAQSTQLDLTWGQYPFVTSSSCLATNAMLSVGYRFNFDKVYGVFKAYTTRVGTGPFITSMEESIDTRVREKGKEYGVTTGRPRRCGWLDLVALKRSCLLNGVTDLCMVKSDVFDKDFDKIYLCTDYILNNERMTRYPYTAQFDKVKPLYSEFDGWQNYQDNNLLKYTNFIQNIVGVKIKYLSYSPNREDVIEK